MPKQIATAIIASTIAAQTMGVTCFELPLRGESFAAWLNLVCIGSPQPLPKDRAQLLPKRFVVDGVGLAGAQVAPRSPGRMPESYPPGPLRACRAFPDRPRERQRDYPRACHAAQDRNSRPFLVLHPRQRPVVSGFHIRLGQAGTSVYQRPQMSAALSGTFR